MIACGPQTAEVGDETWIFVRVPSPVLRMTRHKPNRFHTAPNEQTTCLEVVAFWYQAHGSATIEPDDDGGPYSCQPIMLPTIPTPVTILGFPVHPVTYASLLDLVAAFVTAGRPRQVCTANPEFLMTARRVPEFAVVLRQADLVLPDGVGLLWAARYLGHPLPERVTGSDGIYLLAERAAKEGWRLYLLGAAPGVAVQAGQVLAARYPGLAVAGAFAGSPADRDYPAIAGLIRQSQPHILLVCYGAPGQDLWIARHIDDLAVPVCIGVGGAFDHIVGVQRRAPRWLIRLNLEWLWRLLTQPWRWRRQLDLPRFILAVLREHRR